MLTRLLAIRPEDRREAIFGFVTLLGVMTGHSVLETTRDALFLSRLPARHLPWTYIAIAAFSLALSRFNRRALHGGSRRRALSWILLGGAAITGAFWLVPPSSTAALFAIYVWTGVLATTVVVEFWLLIGQIVDFGQAKRVFSFVAAGGLVGAVLGSALATVLLMFMPPRGLLVAASAVLALTALAPRGLSPRSLPRQPRRALLPRGQGLRLLQQEPYLRRVFWVVLVSTVVVTGVDFLFKAMVSVDVATDQLAPFFARFYVVMNGLALVVQLLLGPRLLRILGVNGSLLLLPALLLVGSAGFVLTAGLGSAMLLRGADGTLRHSLNRTGLEILYLPLPPGLRARFKIVAESVGQRGGQAMASILLLAAVALGFKPLHIGLGLIAFAALWLGAIYGVKPYYLDLFRRNLREGTVETNVEVSDLDLSSFEALISALSSENDYEVLGALDILAYYGKANLIPALILYHPSPVVVMRAFEHFAHSRRTEVHRLTARLLAHSNPEIRAAALRAHSEQDPDAKLLERMQQDESPLVGTTATVHLIRGRFVGEFEAGDILRGIIDGDSASMRLSLARAARDLPKGRYAWALIRLAAIREAGLSREVAESMAEAPDLEFLPTLIRLLADRDCRDHARAAIVALGDPALEALEAALLDPVIPRRARRHLPRTISRFGGSRAAQILMRHLDVEQDEVVVLKVLRGLGAMRQNDPSLRVDRRALLRYARVTLERAVSMLYFRLVFESIGQHRPDLHGAGAELLTALLRDKEVNALERVFRLLQIVEPTEEFRMIHSGVKSPDPTVRGTSIELLSNVVREPLRTGLLALVDVDTGPLALRLEEASRFYSPKARTELASALAKLEVPETVAAGRRELETLGIAALREMLSDSSHALSSVASYRIAELGLGHAPVPREKPSIRPSALAELASGPDVRVSLAQQEIPRA